MLDKSIPYRHIIMMLPYEDNNHPVPELPDGYTYHLFRPGDEHAWAKIETSVLEFENEERALAHYTRIYLPHLPELQKRAVFIANPRGELVATATAWRDRTDGKASIVWVAVKPSEQGKHLGRAVLTKALSLFPLYEPGRDIYLHTQTWSHIAVRLYASIGFRLCRTSRLGDRSNDYTEAVDVLRTVFPEDYIEFLTSRSVE